MDVVDAQQKVSVEDSTDDVTLEVYDDSEYKKAVSDNLNFPCVVLFGITTEEEVAFFKSRITDDEMSLPLYGDLEGQKFYIGNLELSLNTLLSIRSIYDYKLLLMKNSENSVSIDLDDADTLIKFIKL